MIAELQQIVGGEPRARRLEFGRRHARRQLHAQIHRQPLGRVEEIAQARRAHHVGDFVRIADRGGGAAGEGAAVELARRHQRRFDMEMRINEARHADRVAAVDFDRAAILFVRADDAVTADRDVAPRDLAGDDIEEARALDHQIGGIAAQRLIDAPGNLSRVAAGHAIYCGMERH